jgi:hypothetical protein
VARAEARSRSLKEKDTMPEAKSWVEAEGEEMNSLLAWPMTMLHEVIANTYDSRIDWVIRDTYINFMTEQYSASLPSTSILRTILVSD